MAREIRDTSKDYAEFIEVPPYIKKRIPEFQYNKGLRIVLYGEPYTDSRPHPNRFGGVQNENMSRMKVSFGQFYERTPLLQELTIESHYSIEASFYTSPSKEDLKIIKNAPSKIKKLFEMEKLGSCRVQDVDNMCKIHNDILFEKEYYIVINDTFNMGFIDPHKYLSFNPRAELNIYYSTNPNIFYRTHLQRSSDYTLWLFSVKNMKINHRTVESQMKHLKRLVKDELRDCNNEVKTRKKLSKMAKFFETYYSSELIKRLSDLENNNKFNKYQAMFKFMSLLVGPNREAKKILNNIGEGELFDYVD